MYKAAVVGCGHRAPAHIEAYRHIPEVEVVACCAPSPMRREPLAAKYGLRAYADIGEMVRAERPDIVHLVTWPDTRVALMTAVADLGVPLCTVEKPIATGVPDWRQLRALEAQAKTKFAVCHQVRWQPYLVKCQDALRSGRLGQVKFLDISAGMNIAGQGTHTLNYGMSLVGDVSVVRVFGNAYGWDAKDPGHPGPATTEAYLTFANGVRGLWTSGHTSPRCGFRMNTTSPPSGANRGKTSTSADPAPVASGVHRPVATSSTCTRVGCEGSVEYAVASRRPSRDQSNPGPAPAGQAATRRSSAPRTVTTRISQRPSVQLRR